MTSNIERLYPLILDSIREGVFTVDRQFRITSFNAEAERIVGVSREHAVGRKCHEVFRASLCQADCALRRTLRTGRPLRNVPVEVLNDRMETVPISVSTAVLKDRSGALLGGVEIFRDISEVEALRREVNQTGGMGELVGRSVAMQSVFRLLPDVAAAEASVLVTGPSGSGKELAAKAIHDLSPRKDRPFVRVNCGALPDSLLESELFGYVKGAFTDARRDKPGRFAMADGGTLFLDEIGDLSPAFQVKLLRVLEDGEVHPLGADAPTRVDVRIVAASNRDLARMVAARTFREDLFYRLRVVTIELPPLSARREDVPLLVDHFVRRLAARTGKRIEGVSRSAMEALSAYDFPGNVRELRNVLERAFVLCHGPMIEREHLPDEVLHGRGSAAASAEVAGSGGTATVRHPSGPGTAPEGAPAAAGASPEARKLMAALEANRWNRTETARALGVARNTLWRRMRRLGIEK